MTPEAQRITIAEACKFDLWVILKRNMYYRPNAAGYTFSIQEAWKVPYSQAKTYEMYADRDDIPGNEKVFIEKAPIPDYLNDLNAIFEAVEYIKKTNRPAYEKYAEWMFNQCHDTYGDPDFGRLSEADCETRCYCLLNAFDRWDSSK